MSPGFPLFTAAALMAAALPGAAAGPAECGAWVRSDINAAGNVDIVLYNIAGTADRTVTIDGETTVENTVGLHYVYWADYTLSGTGNTYRLSLKPTTVLTVALMLQR